MGTNRTAGIILKILVAVAVLAIIGFAAKKLIPSLHIPGLQSHNVVPTNTVLRETKRIARITTARYNDDFVYVDREYTTLCYTDKEDYLCKLENLFDINNDNEVNNALEKDSIIINGTTYYPHFETQYLHEAPDPDYYLSEAEENKICYIFIGTSVRAGYDLGKITDDQIRINGDSLSVQLPEVEIFDADINPDDYIVFDKIGNCWTAEIETEIFKNAKDNLKRKAIEKGLLETAEKSGTQLLEKLFQAIGYKDVTLIPYKEWHTDENTGSDPEEIPEEQVPVALPTQE